MYWSLLIGFNPSLFVVVEAGWVEGELFTLKDKDETGIAEKTIKILNKILLIDHKYLETYYFRTVDLKLNLKTFAKKN